MVDVVVRLKGWNGCASEYGSLLVDRWMEEAGREREMGGQVDLYSLAQGRDCLAPSMLGAFDVNYSTRGAVDASGEGNSGAK